MNYRTLLAGGCTLLCGIAVTLAHDADRPTEQNTAAKPAEELKEEQDKKKKEKWDVGKPPGPSHEVDFDLDEGTWMNVDVSPDGRTVLFDLLGDIYQVPIEGGKARPLSEGFAWDMQPRFSPDGKRIVFTSDRGGGDNLWIMDADGNNPRAATDENFRLLNDPVWSPDGEFVAARKHFTSKRSLGAGEIWFYHRSGGKGIQLTERPNDQKDVGEPAFSPDGRYVYFSQDTTPGGVFEYNKDSNTQIYTIRRLDRETGDTESIVTGPGGAIAPAPSPDGKHLAFVRRVRFQSTLFLRELRSGAERAIYAGLDRDMQETWAVHGVYPNMAWTPDSKSIVFWAGGKILRLSVDSGETHQIPFRVRTRRALTEALRFPVDVCPPEFKVRMLRWVRMAPDESAVAYQALGYIWLRALPEGEPRRLTRQNTHFEFFPAFSADGKWIAYTTWDDETYGDVRVASVQDGASRAITTEPGHYLEPVFSPDGSQVVYRKARGDRLRGRLWSSDPGLYLVPVDGGEPRRIIKEGSHPQFGSDTNRLFYMSNESGRRAFKSVELDGSDERTHFTSENATDYQVSPNERWLAFREQFNAYLIPFVRGGKAVQIGPKTESIPIRKASADAGEYLQWSGDGKRLYWALGPELFSVDLTNAFSFMPGAPEKLPEPPKEGRDISFLARADRPEGMLILTGGRIVTMRGDEIIDRGVVRIEGNRVTAVGAVGSVEIPPEARVIDVSGATVFPGLIDVHAHGPHGSDEITPEVNWHSLATLVFGVTTIHDPSNDTSTIFAASEMARTGSILAPRIFSTGTILYGADGDIKAEIDRLEDARSHLRRMKAVGAFSVKSYNQPRRDQRQQVITAARELGMMVVPEGGSLLQHNLTMIADGHTGIEHSIPMARIYRDVLEFWAASGTSYTPTLGVGYGGIWGENYWYQHTDVWKNERLLRFVPREDLDARSRRRTMAPPEEYNHLSNARICKELLDAGVSIQLGAHGQREGLAAHWELWMFVQGGMTPHESWRAGTIAGAEYLGLDRDLGSIVPGKLADLIVVDGRPLENIRDSERVLWVVLNGRAYDATRMTPNTIHAQLENADNLSLDRRALRRVRR